MWGRYSFVVLINTKDGIKSRAPSFSPGWCRFRDQVARAVKRFDLHRRSVLAGLVVFAAALSTFRRRCGVCVCGRRSSADLNQIIQYQRCAHDDQKCDECSPQGGVGGWRCAVRVFGLKRINFIVGGRYTVASHISLRSEIEAISNTLVRKSFFDSGANTCFPEVVPSEHYLTWVCRQTI